MKRLSFLFSLLIICGVARSQDVNAEKAKRPSPRLHSRSEEVATKYGNLENEIEERLISKSIPSNFPVYDPKAQTKDTYIVTVDAWVKENQFLVKPEYRTISFNESPKKSD